MLRNIYFLKYFTLNKSHAVRIFLGYENSYRLNVLPIHIFLQELLGLNQFW